MNAGRNRFLIVSFDDAIGNKLPKMPVSPRSVIPAMDAGVRWCASAHLALLVAVGQKTLAGISTLV